jgi:hypothetical protein
MEKGELQKAIVESERKYVEELGVILSLYHTPLRAHPETYGLERSDVMTIFYNIHLIKEINEEVLRKFDACLSGNTTLTGFGAVFNEVRWEWVVVWVVNETC